MISIERVEELKAEIGAEDFAEIVALFVSESDLIVGRLEAVHEPSEAEELLHALNGSALNLGFETLAGLCAEGQGSAAGSTDWLDRFRHLHDVYLASKSRLAALT